MSDIDIHRITSWLVARGLAGALETDLMQGFCTECRREGLQLSRAMAFIDTLHPVHEGRAFRWRNDGHEESPFVEYGRTNEGEAAARWQRTPFYRLVTTGESELRRRLARGDPADFTMIEELKAAGQTDYLAFIHRFAADGVIGEMDCIYSYWTSDRPDGFHDREVDALNGACTAYSKCAFSGRRSPAKSRRKASSPSRP